MCIRDRRCTVRSTGAKHRDERYAHGLSSSVTALLLSPIANELPETVNAIIWGRQGKTQPALGNISGAMMIQATVLQRLGSAVRRLALQQRPAVVRADHHGRHRRPAGHDARPPTHTCLLYTSDAADDLT